MSRIKQIASEAVVEVKERETELVIYAKLDSFDYLDALNTYRDFIQLEASLGASQHCRCRSETTVIKGQAQQETPVYEFTVKTNGKRSNTVSNKIEYNFKVDQDLFEYFQNTAEGRQIKKRYTFKVKDYEVTATVNGQEDTPVIIPELLFEIDVFEKSNGYRSPWVKIDIELNEAFKYLENKYRQISNISFTVRLKTLPFILHSGFIEKTASREQKEMLDNLWSYEFKENLRSKRA